MFTVNYRAILPTHVSTAGSARWGVHRPPLPAEPFNVVRWPKKRRRETRKDVESHTMNQVLQVAQNTLPFSVMLTKLTRRKAAIGVRVPSPN